MAGMNSSDDTVTITVEVERPFGKRYGFPGEVLEVSRGIAEQAIARNWARPGRHGDGQIRPRQLPARLVPPRGQPAEPTEP